MVTPCKYYVNFNNKLMLYLQILLISSLVAARKYKATLWFLLIKVVGIN